MQAKGYDLFTRHDNKKWELMLWFETAREAMEWLVTTYQPDADFWKGCEFKILEAKD